MACVVVDIGNTSTAIGVAAKGTVSSVCHLQGGLKDRAAIRHVLRGLAGKRTVEGSVLCSVVPATNKIWLSLLKQLGGRDPLLVTHRVRLGVEISYPKPSTIGGDRLANACAAVHRYGAPVIVADFGTALTFDVVSKDGTYIGGVIAPGLPLMTDYLADKTALLPHIRLKGPHGDVGKSTQGAMRLGAKVGYRGMVREIVAHLTDVLQSPHVNLCATGGYAKWAIEDLDLPFRFDPNLTLLGLGRIFELNAAS